MPKSWPWARRVAPCRHLARIEITAVTVEGGAFEDARFDLFVDGKRAGYGLSPRQVKTEIEEGLDIEMRRIAGFAPPSR